MRKLRFRLTSVFIFITALCLVLAAAMPSLKVLYREYRERRAVEKYRELLKQVAKEMEERQKKKESFALEQVV